MKDRKYINNLPKADAIEELQNGYWTRYTWNLPGETKLHYTEDTADDMLRKLGRKDLIIKDRRVIGPYWEVEPKDDRIYHIPEEVFKLFLLVTGRS